MRSVLELVSLTILTHISFGSSYIFVDDARLFRLNWVNDKQTLTKDFTQENSVVMTTADNEQYRCFLPISENQQLKNTIYSGPSAKVIMKPIFKQQQCTQKVEPYWNYELCYGKYLRQYHEEKLPGKDIKLLEFYLGYYQAPARVPIPSQTESNVDRSVQQKIPTKRLNGIDFPYYEVLMSNGTLCDITHKKARLTRLKYICDLQGRNELINLEEISTCEYEGIVLSPTLCAHPHYKLKEMPLSDIQCEPFDGSPLQPSGYGRHTETKNQNQYSSTTVHVMPPSQQSSTPTRTPQEDYDMVQNFLKGKYCLSGGGNGWWMYTFCYGKHVHQYHDEKTGVGSTTIVLGTWNVDEHIVWYHSNKRLRTQSKSITQFYGNGAICDLTGKPRQVQVKLQCKETRKPPSVALFLQEPISCDYILTIESSIICSLLSTVDENGLIHFTSP